MQCHGPTRCTVSNSQSATLSQGPSWFPRWPYMALMVVCKWWPRQNKKYTRKDELFVPHVPPTPVLGVLGFTTKLCERVQTLISRTDLVTSGLFWSYFHQAEFLSRPFYGCYFNERETSDGLPRVGRFEKEN